MLARVMSFYSEKNVASSGKDLAVVWYGTLSLGSWFYPLVLADVRGLLGGL
jgi:hypothetical protein